MKKRRRFADTSVYESYSDMVLLMLALFIFLFTVVLMTARLGGGEQTSKLKNQVASLEKKLQQSEHKNQSLAKSLEEMAVSSDGSYLDQIVDSSTFNAKDFDLFIRGLQELPGHDLHLVIDATGSMHGVTSFLVPVLRVLVAKSGKHLAAVTWYANNSAETYMGTMGEMFDRLIQGAPFVGSMETIGHAFRVATKTAPPGAYILVGDEPPIDSINYSAIPSPVFTLPLGRSDVGTSREYQIIAQKTGGKMLHLDFK